MKHLNFLSNLLSLSLGSPCTDVSLDRRLTVGSPSGRYCSGLMRLVFILAILLTIGSENAWGTAATMTGVSNASAVTVSSKSAFKCGTNSSGGSMKVTVPTGATSLTIYIAAWNGESPTISVAPTAKVNTTSISPTSDSGLSGSGSTFTLNGTEATYRYTITLKSITSSTDITFSSSGGKKRFVAWGAEYSTGASTYSITYADAGGSGTNGTYSASSTSSISSGTTITLTATPADCYQLDEWSVYKTGDASTTVTVTSNQFTMPAYNVTVGASFEAKAAGKTVNFDAGPGSCATSSLTETCSGSGVTLPTVTATGVCKGWTTFAGWATAAVNDSSTTSGVTLYAAGSTYVPASNNMTLYAVYSKVKGGGTTTLLSENFADCSSGNNTSTSGSGTSWSRNDNFYSGSNTYQAGGAVKLGGSSSVGYLITKQLTAAIGDEITVSFKVKGWTTVEGNIQVEGNNSEFAKPSATTYTATISGSFESKSVTVTLTKANPKIKIGTTNKRAFLDDLVITKGGSTTYYCSDPDCCTPLGTINGSFSLSSTSTSVTATVTTEGVSAYEDAANVSGYEFKLYTAASGGSASASYSTNSSAGTSHEFTGLTPLTDYWVTVRPIGDGSTYCNTTAESNRVQITTLCVAPDHVTVTGRWDRFVGETISLTATPYDDGDNEITTGITGYQWQKLVNSAWTNVSGANVSGATSANLQITSCTAENSGKYRCQITTGAGCTTASATATDGTQGFSIKVFILECYNDGTKTCSFTRIGDTQTGTTTLTLAANTAYTFKFHVDNIYYGNNASINEDITNYVFCNSSNGGNCASNFTINSGLGGTFTLGIDYSSAGGNSSIEGEPELSITYPRKTIYLTPGDWNADGAKFALYYFRDAGGSGWTDFITADDCGSSTEIPQWNGVKINAVRLKNTCTSPNWDDKWNQTSNITITSNNSVSITGMGGGGDSPYTYGNYAVPTYTISYAKGSTTYTGGNTITGSKDSETKTCGVDFTLPSSAVFSATGYTQTGWTTSDGGSQAYAFGGTYATNATQAFYPAWTVNTHELTWSYDGGTPSGSYTAAGTVAYGTALTAPTMTKNGYTFNGWSPAVPSTMPDDDVTCTATWSATSYDITYNNMEGATNHVSNPASYTIESGAITLQTPTKTGYTFGGWFTDADLAPGHAVSTPAIAAGSTGNKIFYAKWTATSYTITYNNMEGATNHVSNPASYTIESSDITLQTPTKTGYTFGGWFTDSDLDPSHAVSTPAIAAGSHENKTFWAKWTAKIDTYKTALHTGESGWTSYASGVTKSGAGYTIPAPSSVAKGATSTCEDTHYHFAGWVTDANKEAGTISGNVIAASGTTDATGTTYWAVWEKVAADGNHSIELDYSSFSLTTSYAEKTATVGGIGFNVNQGYKGASNCIQMNSSKGEGVLYNTTAISGLDSIKLYCTSAGATATIYQGSSEKPTSTSDPDERVGTAACAASTNYKIAFTGSGEYFTLKVGGATYFSKIEVYYSTYDDPKAECEACAATPSISGVSLSGSSVSLTSVPVQATGAAAGTNCSITEYGFYWGTSANPTGNSTASANLSAGTFSATLTGPFEVGTPYYYRAFATNEAPNTGYSSDGTFTLRSVTFDLNGHGSSAPSTQYVLNGGKASDPSYSESVTNWRFVGWYDEVACRDGHEWVFGTNTVSGANATIYAKWLPDPTITFSVPTGVDAVASQRASVNLPTPTGFPSAVDDDCWAFAGWTESSSVNSTDKPATFYPAGAPYSGSQTSPFTLYAVYSRNKYLVVYDNDMLVADADYVISTWDGDTYAVVGTASGSDAEVADLADNFHDKTLKGLHYYTLDNPTENAVWHLTGTTGSYVLQNKATGKYLDVAGASLISNSSATVAVTEGTGEDKQTYKVTGGDNHLVIASSGASVATGDATYYFLYKLISSKYMTSPAEPTYTVTWKVAGEDDQTTTVNACEGLTAAQISALTIPDDDHLEVKNSGCITNTKGKFMGWSTRELGSTSGQGDPGDLFKTYDKAPYLTGDLTVYAVFAEASVEGDPYYGLVEEDGDATEGTYLIVYNGTYALNTHYDGTNTDTYSTYTDISSHYDGTNKKIASNGTTDALAYIAEKTTNGYSLKHSETISSVATDVYLGCSKNNNKGLRWDYPFTASTDEWLLAAGSINSVGQPSRYIRWNSTSGQERFATYISSAVQDIQLYKYNPGVTYSNYRTNCCDKTVTIGTPTKTGSGTVTFASGGNSYAAGDEVGTCEGGATITVTITPNDGHKCTVLEFTRSDEASLTPSPAISVPFTGTQSYNLTFEENADGVTLNTTVTFVALHDYYIDNMHYNTTVDKSGGYGTAPTLSDETKGTQCTGLHYKFIGWIPESDMNMTTGVPTTTANMVVGGATGKYATGTNYYAIWAEEE